MYNFLKVLLKTVGYVPPAPPDKPDKPDAPIKTRVVKFLDRCELDPSYVAQYKKLGIWHNFTKFLQLYDEPQFWYIDQPVLDKNFDKLVRFCQKFQTHADIKAYHTTERAKYDKAVKTYHDKLKKSGACNRKWESN